MPSWLDKVSDETWRYAGAGALALLGVATWRAGFRRRGVTAGDTCPVEVYVQQLGAHGVREDVARRAWLYVPYVRHSAEYFGVSPAILAGLIHTESRWNPNAMNPSGAVGLTQFMPKSAVARFRRLFDDGRWPFGPISRSGDPQAGDLFAREGIAGWVDRTDPQQSVWLGAAGLRANLELGRGVEGALASYNAGPAATKGTPSTWPEKTQTYVPKVLQHARWYEDVWNACP